MSLFRVMHKTIAILVFLSVCTVSVVAAEMNKGKNQEWKLSEEQWDLVKQGDQLLNMPLMQQVVNQWSSLPSWREHGIELHYPGGEEGELWVQELKDSLISLGIPSQYLLVVPGSGEADIIVIKISKLEMYGSD